MDIERRSPAAPGAASAHTEAHRARRRPSAFSIRSRAPQPAARRAAGHSPRSRRSDPHSRPASRHRRKTDACPARAIARGRCAARRRACASGETCACEPIPHRKPGAEGACESRHARSAPSSPSRNTRNGLPSTMSEWRWSATRTRPPQRCSHSCPSSRCAI